VASLAHAGLLDLRVEFHRPLGQREGGAHGLDAQDSVGGITSRTRT
jgi:hypothetical protein